MTTETAYIIFSTLLTGVLGFIWHHRDGKNLLVKFALLGNAFVGGYLILTNGLLG